MTPRRGISNPTVDGIEEEWSVNYLSTFHLLSILSPAIRAQPPDRDVRILFSTCSSYIGGSLAKLPETERATKDGSASYKRSKLALMIFIQSFQKHLDAYKRPDGHPNNARSFVIDPGFCRTPGTRRWLTGGSLWGLALYLLAWPLWWLILKSPQQGSQTYLLAAMEAELSRGPGGKLLKECREREFLRPEITDEEAGKSLWEFSEKQVERLEKESAVKRALKKKEEGVQTPEKTEKTGNGKKDAKAATSTASATATERPVEAAAAAGRQSGVEKKGKSGSRRSRKT